MSRRFAPIDRRRLVHKDDLGYVVFEGPRTHEAIYIGLPSSKPLSDPRAAAQAVLEIVRRVDLARYHGEDRRERLVELLT